MVIDEENIKKHLLEAEKNKELNAHLASQQLEGEQLKQQQKMQQEELEKKLSEAHNEQQEEEQSKNYLVSE